jgi:hypothetical protein
MTMPQFVAQPSPVHQLSIGAAFKSLTDQEQKYAHHMARFAVSLGLPLSPFRHIAKKRLKGGMAWDQDCPPANLARSA